MQNPGVRRIGKVSPLTTSACWGVGRTVPLPNPVNTSVGCSMAALGSMGNAFYSWQGPKRSANTRLCFSPLHPIPPMQGFQPCLQRGERHSPTGMGEGGGSKRFCPQTGSKERACFQCSGKVTSGHLVEEQNLGGLVQKTQPLRPHTHTHTHKSLGKTQIPGPRLTLQNETLWGILTNALGNSKPLSWVPPLGLLLGRVGVGSGRLPRGLSPLVLSSSEGPPGDSDRVLRGHPAHLTLPGALRPKPCLLPLPQVLPAPDPRGGAQEPVELCGRRLRQ